MAENLDLKAVRVKDESRFDQDTGQLVKERVYTFKLGLHGPFTVRTPQEPFDQNFFQTKVTELRTHLLSLPK